MKRFFLACAALVAASAFAQTATIEQREDRGFQPMVGTRNVGTPMPTEAACDAVLIGESVRLRQNLLAKCRNEKVKRLTFNPAAPVVCDLPPAPTSATIACAAPLVGSWTQTATVTIGAAPSCTRTTTLSPLAPPAGACTQPSTEPPPPGTAYYFSDCQAGSAAGCVPGSNANPGTRERPKQNLAGFNYNGAPAGTHILFNRGGAWSNFALRVENMNATAAAPLVFDAYGTGPAPLLRVASGNMFNLGGNWDNQTNDGGYVFRNLKLDGMNTAEWGFWFVQRVRDVTIENNEITGFRIGINSNDTAQHTVTGIAIRNNNVHRNRAMGMLGHYNNIVIEGNTWEANNFGGSTFDHGTYIGGGRNITVRNNRYLRNSSVNGQCTGGNMTFHGQIENLLVEGNIIEQDAAAPQCWLMSVTQGYSSPEWFRNAVIRNNVMKNCGNTCMAVQSAPGVVVEGNVVVSTQPTAVTAFAIGSGGPGPNSNGDDGDANAQVRNNTVCRRNAGATGSIVTMNSPGGTQSNNVVVTGAAASAGVCAR